MAAIPLRMGTKKRASCEEAYGPLAMPLFKVYQTGHRWPAGGVLTCE